MNFDFNTDYILENDNVLLRPLQESDYDNLLEFSINEPEIWTYSTQFSNASGEEGLKRYIANALDCRIKGTEYPFIVFDKKLQRYAGSTRLYAISLLQKSWEIGYTWYGKDFQGTGLNKNCKYLLLEFSFEKTGIERVGFIADNNNKRSIAAMKSIGCTLEGILRSNIIKADGSRRDSAILSIIKEDWEKDVKINLKNKCNV